MVFVPASRSERVDGGERAERADALVEVAAADADAVRHAPAQARDQARHFLQPGAGGRDDADVAARHGVGESDRRAGDERGAAVRPHEQQAPSPSPARLSARSSSSGTPDENTSACSPASSALRASSAAKSPGTEMSARFALRQQLERAGEGAARGNSVPEMPAFLRRSCRADASAPAARALVGRAHRDHEVVGARPARLRPRAARRRAAAPCSTGVPIISDGVFDAGKRGEAPRQAHQRDRVEVAPALDAVKDDRGQRAPSRSRRAARAPRPRRPGRRRRGGARCRC